jgi:ABC-type phosphate/phosphonate transport system substrate-binding protein
MYRRLFGLLVFMLCLTAFASGQSPVTSTENTGVRVGMPRTLFHDLPPVMVRIATRPFGAVLREMTGLSGEIIAGGEPEAVAQQLVDGKLDLAVFYSFEFGWVKKTHPELRPLMVAVNEHRSVSAYILVRKDSSATLFADLKGKKFYLPAYTREHCRIYLERLCHCDGNCGSKDYFGHIDSSDGVEGALDDLCGGEVQAAVVDVIGMDFYKYLKPGCFNKLRILAQSEPFPPPVIVYRHGGLSAEALARFRDGMLRANQTDSGRKMMRTWSISAFEAVPENYDEAVAACLKLYPCPEAKP